MADQSRRLATSLSSSLRSPCGAAAELVPSVLIVVFSLASSHPRRPGVLPRDCAPPVPSLTQSASHASAGTGMACAQPSAATVTDRATPRPAGRAGDLVRLRPAHLNTSQASGVLAILDETHTRIQRSVRNVAGRISFRSMGTELDATDWAIIAELQRDARLSFNQIAKRVNLSAPSVAARIRRLEEAGVIEGYHAQISPAAAGWPVRSEEHTSE